MHGDCYGDDALEERHGACGGALYDAAEIGDYGQPSLADAADGENSAAADLGNPHRGIPAYVVVVVVAAESADGALKSND